MFLQIFLFEIKYRLRRPAFYVYFAAILLLGAMGFAQGDVAVVEKELVNAPASLALFSSMASIFLMLVSSAIMGVPLYRDIEHNTKEYYLSYPITEAGYFWGRYLGSFLFVLLTGAAALLGAWIGSRLGPVLGWTPANRYGADHFSYYVYPYFTLIVPNLFFTSSIFFGLVAIFRNVKVIYSSGMFLFLGYIIGNFFLHNIHNPAVIYLSDPFLVNGMRLETGSYPPLQLNTSVVKMQGLLLENRIIWISVGGLMLLFTWLRFSFGRFFGVVSGKSRKGQAEMAPGVAGTGGARIAGSGAAAGRASGAAASRPLRIRLEGSYFRKTLYSLSKIEILNIVRDNYFWIILSGGLIFLSFVFWHGPGNFGVLDYPRTVFFMLAFGDNFNFFLFFILIFYTGETVHREKATRYAFINDALPPPTWVLNTAKLISLCCLAVALSLIPILLGVAVQLIKGYHSFNFPLYFSSFFLSTLPRLIEMVLFCYAVHIIVNNKFAAHGIGITVWVLLFVLTDFGIFNYNLLLYSYTPFAVASDMDGIGHMARPIAWYNSYWSIGGALLVLIGSLFYARGVSSSFSEKIRLARQRFHGASRIGAALLLTGFLAVGGYIYYNVSYLNDYITPGEKDERAIAAELQLKKYAGLPMPRITRMQLYADIYPQEQKELTRAFVTIMNKGKRPIDSLLLDGDNLTEYSLRYKGMELSYTCPLYFPRGKFNWFRPWRQASDYRLYVLPAPLMPGDTARIEVNSVVAFRGFRNGLYGATLLRNGVFYTGGLPGLGYDDDEEIGNNNKRKKYGLPEKTEVDIPQDDSAAMRSVVSEFNGDLVSLDMTVSTPVDQRAVAPGVLEKEWEVGGRRYFHYVQDHPAIYPPFGIAVSRFSILRDTVWTGQEQGQPVNLEIDYQPSNALNLSRFDTALKDGLQYCSGAYGPYPFHQLRLIEGPMYASPTSSFINTLLYGERFGWNADLRQAGQFDYIYYSVTGDVARQWWGQQVAPNQTVGAKVISDGLSTYTAIVLMGKKYGSNGIKRALQMEGRNYRFGRGRNFNKENDLLHSNRWYLGGAKTGIVLNGLRGLIGADSLNAALREFRDEFAFRDGGVYAGSRDLYRVLQQHVPDSFLYYLEDTWERVCLYDNRILEVSAKPLGKDSLYSVSLTIEIKKLYYDSLGNDRSAIRMNDYIDIGAFSDSKGGDPEGMPSGVLYLKRWRLTAGRHRIEFIVKGKPGSVGIDPDRKLLDRNMEDNGKDL
jgi:ABC-2 type transport system permease protein